MINYVKHDHINPNPRYTIEIVKHFLNRNSVESNNNDEDSKIWKKA